MILTNLLKSVAALAAVPVAAVADVLSLPASAYNGYHPFGNAKAQLKRAGECFDAATKPVEPPKP